MTARKRVLVRMQVRVVDIDADGRAVGVADGFTLQDSMAVDGQHALPVLQQLAQAVAVRLLERLQAAGRRGAL